MSDTNESKDAGVPKVYGIIPAAGRSARMGRPKQLLPFRGSTVLGTVIESVLAGRLDGLVVVTNPKVNEILKLTDSDRHLTAILDDADAEMIESVTLGADTLIRHYHPTETDAFVVCPGDIAAVTDELVAGCTAEYRAYPQRIVVAALGARIGHPIVVPFSMRGELDQLRGVGLKQILVTHADRVRKVQSPSDESMTDLDTPEDYQALQE